LIGETFRLWPDRGAYVRKLVFRKVDVIKANLIFLLGEATPAESRSSKEAEQSRVVKQTISCAPLLLLNVNREETDANLEAELNLFAPV